MFFKNQITTLIRALSIAHDRAFSTNNISFAEQIQQLLNKCQFLTVIDRNEFHKRCVRQVYENMGKVSAVRLLNHLSGDELIHCKDNIEHWAKTYEWKSPGAD